MTSLTDWVFTSLLLSLRISPVFAFAPPFTLVPLPASPRMLLGLGISATLVGGGWVEAAPPPYASGALAEAAVRELLLGTVFVMVFQLTFGALYFVGRTIDIQAGFGLAALIDPTSRVQTPLVGSILAYATGAVFFAVGGHLDLLTVFAASIEAVPIGTWSVPGDLGTLTTFIGMIFAAAFGAGGAIILLLLLADVALALLSRTTPQLNVLVLGFQVKTLLLMITMPLILGFTAAAFARMATLTLEALPSFF